MSIFLILLLYLMVGFVVASVDAKLSEERDPAEFVALAVLYPLLAIFLAFIGFCVIISKWVEFLQK